MQCIWLWIILSQALHRMWNFDLAFLYSMSHKLSSHILQQNHRRGSSTLHANQNCNSKLLWTLQRELHIYRKIKRILLLTRLTYKGHRFNFSGRGTQMQIEGSVGGWAKELWCRHSWHNLECTTFQSKGLIIIYKVTFTGRKGKVHAWLDCEKPLECIMGHLTSISAGRFDYLTFYFCQKQWMTSLKLKCS